MKVGSLKCECGQQFEFRTRRSFVDCPKCEKRLNVEVFPEEEKPKELSLAERIDKMQKEIEELTRLATEGEDEDADRN